METFFLACFAFGVLFTLASVVLGSVGGAHFGHGGHVAPHVGHVHAHAHVAHGPEVGHGPEAPHATAHDSTHHGALPLLNASSVVGGLTWFGAAGYLLLRLGNWALPAIILIALIAGGIGWYLVARFLGLVLKGETEMDPEDYRLEGTVGQVTASIPAGGTGEVVFTKADSRRFEAARAVGGVAIPRGSEVVITAYADGFAMVQPWGEFMAEHEQLKLGSAQQKEA